MDSYLICYSVSLFHVRFMNDRSTLPTAVRSAAKFGVPRPVTCSSNVSKQSNQKLPEQSTHRIPSGPRREAIRAAPGVRPRRNIIQGARARRVQERVQEPKRRLARRDELAVEQRDHAREDGARAARAADEPELLLEHDLDVVALRTDVGKRAPGAVEAPLFVLPSALRYAETALAWYEGVAKTLEKPPEEKDADVSGTPVVAPTEVRLQIDV
ncbi:hypothetical protein EWM64_g9516 [Hericium alpestre]|uniref:Uncharacterized protein n=1 Tax=Hericium alpestre TaxID=135208 RepID=A0A4Y9ZIA7_9AGAM|nr:hypothetical protein EWM64_g9516 [Hericium alpestre]